VSVAARMMRKCRRGTSLNPETLSNLYDVQVRSDRVSQQTSGATGVNQSILHEVSSRAAEENGKNASLRRSPKPFINIAKYTGAPRI